MDVRRCVFNLGECYGLCSVLFSYPMQFSYKMKSYSEHIHSLGATNVSWKR